MNNGGYTHSPECVAVGGVRGDGVPPNSLKVWPCHEEVGLGTTPPGRVTTNGKSSAEKEDGVMGLENLQLPGFSMLLRLRGCEGSSGIGKIQSQFPKVGSSYPWGFRGNAEDSGTLLLDPTGTYAFLVRFSKEPAA